MLRLLRMVILPKCYLSGIYLVYLIDNVIQYVNFKCFTFYPPDITDRQKGKIY